MYQKLSAKLIGTAAAVALLCGAAVADDWRGWNIHVDGYPNTVAMDKFAELLAEKTGGEITLQMFHGGTLGSQPDAIEQVRLGALEIGNFNLGPIGPIAAEANVVSLPFIFKDVPHMFRVLEGDGRQGDRRRHGRQRAWFRWPGTMPARGRSTMAPSRSTRPQT